MLKPILLILTLVIFTISSIVWHMPLNWLLKQVEIPAQLKLNQVEGKIWAGTAQKVTWQKQQISNVQWQANVLALLNQQIDATVNGVFLKGNFNGDIVAQQTTVKINNAHYNNQIQNILEALKQGFVELTGDISSNIKELEYSNKDKKITNLKAKIIWENATITLPLQLKLGQITSISKTINNKIITKINGISGDIDIKGTITINENKNYIVRLQLHPNIKLTNEIKLSLRLIGQEKPNGDFVINKKGNLSYLNF